MWTVTGSFPCADMDDGAGFNEICRRVLADGARSVLYLAFAEDGSGPPQRRREAVRAATSRSVRTHLLARDYNDRSGTGDIEQALRRLQLDAVICDCDDYAALALAAATRIGRTIVPALTGATEPQPLIITGCDDAPVRAVAPTKWMTLRHDYQTWMANAITR